MRRIKIGLGIAMVLVCSIAMTASSASAALSFLSTAAKEKLLSTNVKEQIFTTNPGTTTCDAAVILKGETGGTAGAEELSQLAEITYEECTAFGFIPTEISNADYIFLPSGEVHIAKLIKILSAGCEVSVPAQLVKTVEYSTVGKNIKLEPKVENILYTAAKCPTGNGEAKNGKYTGSSEVMIANGSLSFMP